MTTQSKPGPRERLLAAGQDLFYARGAGVGVDALLKEANVARRSLYEHFGGKDGLIEAVIRRASEQDIAWLNGLIAAERRETETTPNTGGPKRRATRTLRRKEHTT